MKRTYILFGTLAAAAILLWNAQAAAVGVRAGLTACAGVIIPSLFPFMILAGIVASTPAGTYLSRAISPVTCRIMGLPENLGAVLLMSFIGGFPVGARMLADLLERKEIDRETAQRALCFCVNAGPSFLISAVGVSMLGSRMAGLFLLISQLLSALLIGTTLFRGTPTPVRKSPAIKPSGGCFVPAVQSASAGILGICAFVVAFSGISEILRSLGVLDFLANLFSAVFPQLGTAFFTAALTGLLEVTGGCILAAGLHTQAGFILCGFLVSFSSLSILFQVKSCFPAHTEMRFTALYGSRLLHGGLTALFAGFLWRFLPPMELTASVAMGAPVPQATPNMLITSFCLICMCSMLLPRRACS